MMRYLIKYKKKGEHPLHDGKISAQLIDARSREEIFLKLYERLHVREEQFREKFDVIDILEI
jgi:hypothetical protein